MYQLRFGSTILYDPRGANEIDNLYIAEPSTHLEVGTAGSMAFSLPANNPSINKLKRMMGLIELKDGNIPIYRTVNFDLAHSVISPVQAFFQARDIVHPYSLFTRT